MEITNTFEGGMNRDLSLNKYPPNCYYNAENLRYLTNEEHSTGALTNIKGNALKFQLGTGEVLLGSCNIRDTIILFSYKSSDNTSRIYSFVDDGTTTVQTPTLIYGDVGLSSLNKLNFSTQINAIGRYETPTIQKVYWVDGTNPLRFLNIISSETNPISTYTQSYFNIVPDVTFSKPSFNSYTTGNLTSGAVCYSYQLYRVNGQETSFSPQSNIIYLSNKIRETYIKDVKGSPIGTDTGVGVVVDIDDLDTTFNRIRIVAVQYSDINSIPQIRIVEEREFSSTSISVIDVGNSLGTYTVEEFTTIGTMDLIPKTIETKDNYLFAGNNTIDSFSYTWDARAYRFNNSGDCQCTEDADTHYEISSTGTWFYKTTGGTILTSGISWTLPEDANLINPANDLTTDGSRGATDEYVFTSGGAVYGGTGPNVSYSFTYNSSTIDSYYNSVWGIDCVNLNNTGKVAGCQRDEIYRFGIVIFNEKGQKTFPKWIGDIRIPYNDETNPINYISGSSVKAKSPVLTFRVKNLPTNYSYQILYVPRTSSDRTIIGQGLLTHYWYDDTYYKPVRDITTVNPGDQTHIKYVMDFISPEVNFNNNISFYTGDYIEEVAIVSGATATDIHINYRDVFKYYINSSLARTKHELTNAVVTENSTFPYSTFKIYDRTLFNNVSDVKLEVKLGSDSGSRGKALTVTFETDDIAEVGYLVNYKRVVSKQYGGNTYNARTSNIYVACSDLTVSTGDDTVVANPGDTFIQYFDYLRAIMTHIDESPTQETNIQQVVYLPVETSINLQLRGDTPVDKIIRGTTTDSSAFLKEYSGSWGDDDFKLTQTENLYTYNSVYSKVDDNVKYYSKPFDFTEQTVFDTRTYYSEKKINGEYTDSWIQFKVNNFNECDSTYGQIIRLFSHNNILMFFQPEGFGVWSVNQRSVIKDNAVSQLAIGTGGILERFDYLSTNYGISDYNHITHSDNTIYFYDQINNKLVKFQNDEEELSVLKGINSFFSSTVKADTGIVLQYFPLYKEVYMSIPSLTKTLMYNTLLDTFVGFMTFSPTDYIYNNHLYSSYGGNTFYKHEFGDRCKFYGYTANSVLELITNPHGGKICIFNNTEFVLEVTDAGTELPVCFNTVQYSNNYQDTGQITLVVDTNVKKRFRTWRIQIPRNASTTERMRDNYIKTKFQFYNDDNYKIVIHDINTSIHPTQF